MGNVFARRAGEDDSLPPVMTGSHIDTQPTGGRFDGVYGVLAIGLCLLVLRLSDLKAAWNLGVLSWGLRIMNLGMFLQIFLSLFPIGLYQAWTAVAHDYWHSRKGKKGNLVAVQC